MAVQIQFRRGTAQEWSNVNPILAEAEMGIETDTNLFKIGNGFDPWNDLPYGGLRGFAGSAGVTGSVGNIAVENVLYVSKSGSDLNDGKSLNTSKLTIKAAVAAAKFGTTVFVKSGDYTEDNPILVPEGVAIVGDSLRTCIVRPLTKNLDLFWVNNAVYLSQMTFKDYEAPSAAVCFPPDGSAGAIHTSPYVQNCTSITTTGTGMRVDGNHVSGLKSMVVDAFTQYNQGGIGIHMLNRGNTQLVSVFTICCDIGFLCETGGFCSITNANSSFGNYGLKADGVSPALYSGKVKGDSAGRSFTLDNLIVRPNVGDAVKFDGNPDYYTVASSTAFTTGSTELVAPNYSTESASLRNARSLILDAKSKIQVDVIDYLNRKYPDFSYDQFKATRDAGLVIDAVVDDMVFNTNYRSALAGTAYYRRSAETNRTKQKTETVDALFFVKKQALKVLAANYSESSTEYQRVTANFNIVIDTLLNNTESPLQEIINQNAGNVGSVLASNVSGNLIETLVAIVDDRHDVADTVYPEVFWVDQDLQDLFTLIQEDKANLQTAVTNWISQNFPVLEYNVETCQRDVGLIIDAVGYDMLLNSNFKSIVAGISYYRAQASLVIAEQRTATAQAFNYLKTELLALVVGDTTAEERIADNMDIIVAIISGGLSAVPAVELNDPPAYDAGFGHARDNILSNKEFIKAEVIAYINENYAPFNYDQAKCARDTEIIVEGVYYDVALGTNYNSVINGRSYLRAMASEVIDSQKTQTVAALNFLKLEIEREVLEDSFAQKRAVSAVNEIVDIINNGESAVDAIKWTDPGVNANRRHARQQLQVNRSFIVTELISWITVNYPAVTYDQTICARDIGYIVDAVSYDLQYGGNTATLTAARSYFDGAVSVLPSGEKAATAAAYDHLGSILADIIAETYPGQDVSGNPGTETESNRAQTLALIIKSVVLADNLNSLPAAEFPSVTWVNTNIQRAIASLADNKLSIVDKVIDYINETLGFSYNQEVCARDVGYIVDAVVYDLTYGGNTETLTASLAYYSGAVLQIPEKQRLATAGSFRYLKSLVEKIALNQSIGIAPELVYSNPTGVATGKVNAKNILVANRSFLIEEGIAYITANYPSLSYDSTTCKRDIGLIVDAVVYDVLYSGNSQTADAADEYFSGGTLQIPQGERTATAATFNFLKTVAAATVTYATYTPLNTEISRNTEFPSATSSEATIVSGLFDIVANIVENAYTSTVTFEESVPETLDNTAVTFHQYSLITASGHTFEWIGAGTNVNTALPYLGGTPITENQVIQINGGKVYFTGTDQRGDFRIGNDFVINQNTGTISGRTFTKSLFAVMTPYILAIGD
jgi:hypothetical protein